MVNIYMYIKPSQLGRRGEKKMDVDSNTPKIFAPVVIPKYLPKGGKTWPNILESGGEVGETLTNQNT